MSLVFAPAIVDQKKRRSAIERLRHAKVVLPTWRQLSEPDAVLGGMVPHPTNIDPDAPDPANLWRVHWFNGVDRKRRVAVPEHIVLPSELTGVSARIVVLLGRHFPMISAHKVLAAYA